MTAQAVFFRFKGDVASSFFSLFKEGAARAVLVADSEVAPTRNRVASLVFL